MATTGVMAFFNPAEPVYYAGDDGRRLDFIQNAKGDVFVHVRYGLTEINQIFQEHIFIRRNSFNQSFVITHPVLKRSLLRAVANDKVDVFIANGPSTQVKKRKTIEDVFLHKVSYIILVLH